MRALVVVAHPDDEVLGCGGTASLMASRGLDVTACILVGEAGARAGRPEPQDLRKDLMQAHKLLGTGEPILGDFPNIEINTVPHLTLVQFIEAAIISTGAEAVFTHHPSDVNIDHVHTSLACQAAARLPQRNPGATPLRGLFFMEIPSSTDWSYAPAAVGFAANAFVEIGEEGLALKLEALAAYRGVMRPYPHPRSSEAIRGLATYRGAQSGMHLAEAFQTAFLDVGPTLLERVLEG